MQIYLSYSTKLIKPHTETEKKEEIINLFSVCISLLQKLNYNVNIITDNEGYEWFKHFKINSITKELESVYIKYKGAWSVTKLTAFNIIAKKKKPFIHMDYDFFLLKSFEEKLLEADVVVQSMEFNLDNLYYCTPEYHKLCVNKYYAQDYKLNYAYNCGIFGGKNYEFFEEYSRTAIELINDPENKYFFIGPEVHPIARATIPEQYYLTCCLKYFGINPYLYFDNSEGIYVKDFKERNFYNYNPKNFYYLYDKKAVHLLGNFKTLTNVKKLLKIIDV